MKKRLFMDKKKIKAIFAITGLYVLFVFFAYFMGKYAPYIAYYGFADPSNRSETYKSYTYLIMSISLCFILLLILYFCKLKLKDVYNKIMDFSICIYVCNNFYFME